MSSGSLRVLQVSSHLPPEHRGGAERACLELSQALRRAGHEVIIAAGTDIRSVDGLQVVGLPVMRNRLSRKLVFDYVHPSASARLQSILKDFRPNVVHFHNLYGMGSALVRMVSRHCPAIVTLHDYASVELVAPRHHGAGLAYPRRARLIEPWARVHRRVLRFHLARARLISPSRYLANRVGPLLQQDIEVIPNGFPPVANHEGARTNAILLVGRAVEGKGFAEAVPVAADVARRCGWTVDVVGDGPLLPDLRARNPDVRWHGSSDPTKLYTSASILVVPSVWPENAPLVVLEGMAAGIVVVASAAGGIPEQIRNGDTGRLVPPGNQVALHTVLERLITDARLRERMARAGLQQAASYGWDAAAARYIETYHRELMEFPLRIASKATTVEAEHA